MTNIFLELGGVSLCFSCAAFWVKASMHCQATGKTKKVIVLVKCMKTVFVSQPCWKLAHSIHQRLSRENDLRLDALCALIGECGVGELYVTLKTLFLELLEPTACCCHVLKPRTGGAAIIVKHFLIYFVVVEDKTPGELQFEAGLCFCFHKLHYLWGNGVFQLWCWAPLWSDVELIVLEDFGDNADHGARVGMIRV